MLLDIKTLSGEIPIIPERKLPTGAASRAFACHFREGALIPYKNFSQGEPINVDTLSVKLWLPDQGGNLFFPQNFFADYVPGVIDSRDVLYVSGGRHPRAYFSDGGGAPWGVCPPESAAFPTLEYDASGPSPLAETFGTTDYSVCYVYTIVDEFGRESAPSPPTWQLGVYQSKYCLLTYGSDEGEATSAEECLGWKLNNLGPGKKRIYRSTSGSDSAIFLFVAETVLPEWIDFERISFLDENGISRQRGQLIECQADELPTKGFLPPPENLAGIRLLPSGSIAGFGKGTKDLYFSHPTYQYAFIDEYHIKMPQTVRQIEVFGDDLIVFMDFIVCIIRGFPGEMSVNMMPGVHGSRCGSGRAAVVFESGVIFPGSDGLYLYNGATCVNMTKNTTTPEQWQAWMNTEAQNSSLHAVVHDDKYLVSMTGDDQGGITVFDLKTGTRHYLSINFEIKSLYTPKVGHLSALLDNFKGNVWIVGNGFIYRLDFADNFMTAEWESGTQTFFTPVSFASGLIVSDFSPPEKSIQIKLTGSFEGQNIRTVFEGIVPVNRPFRIPGGITTDTLRLAIKTDVPIYSIRLSTSLKELLDVQI